MTTQDDFEVLKERAKLLGITYPAKITTEGLRTLIREHREALDKSNPVVEPSDNIRKVIRDDAMKLVRVRIMNMNPRKKEIKGELITVANEFIGTVTKFIPFDPEFSANGYHIPKCIYENIKERQFLNVRTIKDKTTGRTRVSESWAKEYALEVLPQLTDKELKELAAAQAASGSVDKSDNP